jgi:hypothetical protein
MVFKYPPKIIRHLKPNIYLVSIKGVCLILGHKGIAVIFWGIEVFFDGPG